MSKARRSGRISKQILFLLLGTDTSGRVFSEETTTLVLSRHGAGILSRNKLAPDERLTLRQVGFKPEAEARLVGQIGQQGDAYVYGIEFIDPDINFWQLEFPPPSLPGNSSASLALECSLCGERQVVEQSDIEADVYAVNSSILHFCTVCGISTSWIKARPPTQPAPLSGTLPLGSREPVLSVDSLALESLATPSQAQRTPHPQEGVATAVLDKPLSATPASSSAVRPGGRAANRRRHVRASVNFTACVRQAVSGDEIVECENISRGGASFWSRNRHCQGALIEIAVPYSPGSQAIFVYATIRHVQELPGDRFRYGVEYVKAA